MQALEVKLTVAAVAVFVAALMFGATAKATVHYGSETYGEPPAKEPTIGAPPPPACNPQAPRQPEGSCTEPVEEYETISVAYDDQAGSLMIKVTVYEPELWYGIFEHKQAFTVGSTCPASELEGNFTAPGPIPQEQNVVRLAEYGGSVSSSTPIWTGHAFAWVWQDPAFAHRNWRCLALEDWTVPAGDTIRKWLPIQLGGWPKPKPRHKHHRSIAAECTRAYNRWRHEEAQGRRTHPPPAYCQA